MVFITRKGSELCIEDTRQQKLQKTSLCHRVERRTLLIRHHYTHAPWESEVLDGPWEMCNMMLRLQQQRQFYSDLPAFTFLCWTLVTLYSTVSP